MANFNGQCSSAQQQLLERFLAMYQQLRAENLYMLAEVYDERILFQDPLHQLSGLAELSHYFAGLYKNIQTIQFDMSQVLMSPHHAALTWRMSFEHPKLNGGQQVQVDGMSQLVIGDSNKVTYHRDYFDVGAMLYEQLPLLGSVIKRIKQRASQ